MVVLLAWSSKKWCSVKKGQKIYGTSMICSGTATLDVSYVDQQDDDALSFGADSNTGSGMIKLLWPIAQKRRKRVENRNNVNINRSATHGLFY
jgi:hypothetical protein